MAPSGSVGLALAFAGALLCLANGQDVKPGSKEIWRDDFKPCQKREKNCINGGIRAHWKFELGDGSDHNIPGWGNNELECYRGDKDVAEVVQHDGDGVLHIRALRSDQEFDCLNKKSPSVRKRYSSARMLTKDSETFMWSAGHSISVEARVRLPNPTGKGLWPAFWMLPQPPQACEYACGGYYGGWPLSGEIDIFEATNSMVTAFPTLHVHGSCGVDPTQDCPVLSTARPLLDPTAFHVFGVEWSSTGFRFYINDNVTAEMEARQWSGYYAKKRLSTNASAPFDQPFYIILNLAVGGRLPSLGGGEIEEDAAYFPSEMLVDWVRVVENNLTSPIHSHHSVSAGAIVVGVELVLGTLLLLCAACCAWRAWSKRQPASRDGDSALLLGGEGRSRPAMRWSHWRLPRTSSMRRQQQPYEQMEDDVALVVMPPSLRKRMETSSQPAGGSPSAAGLPLSRHATGDSAFEGEPASRRWSSRTKASGAAVDGGDAPPAPARSRGPRQGLRKLRAKEGRAGGVLTGDDSTEGPLLKAVHVLDGGSDDGDEAKAPQTGHSDVTGISARVAAE